MTRIWRWGLSRSKAASLGNGERPLKRPRRGKPGGPARSGDPARRIHGKPAPATSIRFVPPYLYEDGIAAWNAAQRVGFRERASHDADGNFTPANGRLGTIDHACVSDTGVPQSETTSGGVRTGTQVVHGALDYRWRARLREQSRSTFRTGENRRRDDSLCDRRGAARATIPGGRSRRPSLVFL